MRGSRSRRAGEAALALSTCIDPNSDPPVNVIAEPPPAAAPGGAVVQGQGCHGVVLSVQERGAAGGELSRAVVVVGRAFMFMYEDNMFQVLVSRVVELVDGVTLQRGNPDRFVDGVDLVQQSVGVSTEIPISSTVCSRMTSSWFEYWLKVCVTFWALERRGLSTPLRSTAFSDSTCS
jgi:hypothetical protein